MQNLRGFHSWMWVRKKEITAKLYQRIFRLVLAFYPKNNSDFSEAKCFCSYLWYNYRIFMLSLYQNFCCVGLNFFVNIFHSF